MEIELAVDMAELDRLTAAVEAFCNLHNVPSGTMTQITLVVEELFTNIVSYGFPQGSSPGAAIRLAMTATDGRLVVELTDSGRAFDPLATPPPDLEADIETRPVGGLGIHFLRTMMQDLWYERRDDGNHLGFSRAFAQGGD